MRDARRAKALCARPEDAVEVGDEVARQVLARPSAQSSAVDGVGDPPVEAARVVDVLAAEPVIEPMTTSKS